jgi:chemotaxis protein MotB
MGEEDRTRQVERQKKDEVFEVGDSAIVDASGVRKAPPKGSPVGWIVAALAAAGAVAVYFMVAMPAQEESFQQTKRANELEAKLNTLQGEKSKLAADLTDKEKLAEQLAAESQKKDEILKELTATRTELEDKLKDEIGRGDVGVKEAYGELVVDLADQILFPSGEAQLNEKGKEVLKRVGETMLKVKGKVIQVGGHTDDQPISDKLKTTFPSNWELSTNRALNVVHFLEDEVKVPGERLIASGYSQFKPIAKNKSKEGRKKNRRIEVTLLPLRPKK